MAVGNTNNDGDDTGVAQTVAEEWNGTSWKVLSTPDVGSGDNFLNGVDCPDAGWCVAVGNLGLSATLIETWDGTGWSVASSPTPTGDGGYLGGVSCTSATSCMAVGSSDATGNVANTLAESWDGTNWTIVTTPDGGSTGNALFGVSCTSTTSSTGCVAAGSYETTDTDMLTEIWDGTNWTLGPGFGNEVSFDGVSCTSATNCMAVGSYESSSTMYLIWNGATWHQNAASPDPLDKSNVFSAVSCPGATSCVAVGSSEDSTDIYQTLIETFGSSGWTVTPSPDEIPPPPPTITTFKPQAKPVGKKVTIVGTNLAGAEVSFNGTVATVQSDKATRITTTVPVGATSGPLQVMTAGGSATSGSAFRVKTPRRK
jgi:hypothetical protein